MECLDEWRNVIVKKNLGVERSSIVLNIQDNCTEAIALWQWSYPQSDLKCRPLPKGVIKLVVIMCWLKEVI